LSYVGPRSAEYERVYEQGNILFTKEFEHADFSLDEITLYSPNKGYSLAERAPRRLRVIIAGEVDLAL
jgi:hypothetical protein